MLKIGHRGAASLAPENTLASFKKALELRVDMIEFDVVRCKTGELMIIHDDTVDRTTDGKGIVEAMTFTELRQFDAGRGEKIPTLEETLDLIDRRVAVNIELKGRAVAEPVHRVVQKYINEHGWSLNDFIISSFDHDQLRRYRELDPKVQLSVVLVHPTPEAWETAKELSAVVICPGLNDVTAEFVQEAHSRNLKAFVWTESVQPDIARMEAWGVDGIFTTYPNRA